MKDCSPVGGSLYNSRQMEIITPNIFVSIHYEAVKNLLSQLTSRPITFTEDDYRNLISSPSSCLMLLCRDGVVVGMLTIGKYQSPTGCKAWIEDVVIDDAYRGQGLGRRLVAYAIEQARAWDAQTLMLTSNSKRVAANALYRSLGFEKKDTNVYRMDLNR